MHITDILLSTQLIKRFCRDYNVPVSTFQYPYFEKQLETLSLYNPMYLTNFANFAHEVMNFNSAEDYFLHYNTVKENIINYITNHPQYKLFSERTFSKSDFPKKELYIEPNHSKKFISIDLCKANFTIVSKHCPDLFSNQTWEQVVEQFGGTEYLQGSKYIRQVIFGACNPKKQIQAQVELMNSIATYLTDNNISVYSVVTDEILLENESYQKVHDLIMSLPDATNLKVEEFLLTKFDGGYIKTILNSTDVSSVGKRKLKCVDGDLYCQIIKYFYNKDIEAHDLLFDYKGELAKFVSPIPNPFINTK